MCCIMAFQSTKDCIYDSSPIRLLYNEAETFLLPSDIIAQCSIWVFVVMLV